MRAFDRLIGKFSKWKRTLKSTILCIRFPFLYPRNRFTGNHYDCRTIVDFHRKWWKYTEDLLVIHITSERIPLVSYGEINGNFYYSSYDKNNIYIRDSKGKRLVTIPISDLNCGEIIKCGWKDKKTPYFIVEENWEETHKFITIVHAKWLQRIIKFLDWVNDWPLQLFHCLPTFTELDAMDTGWRKTFGIQMCKEIRSALLKYGWECLFNYRIMQIKEKWGELCWYDSHAPREVFDIIRKYEDISRHTCIDCGAPATKMSTGWICPYCDNCIGDRDYTEIDD